MNTNESIDLMSLFVTLPIALALALKFVQLVKKERREQ